MKFLKVSEMNLNQITVPSINVPRAIEFYKNLGLKLIVQAHERYARFECPDGDSTFSIHHVEQLPKGSGVYVYFEVEEVVSKVNELRALGIHVDGEPIHQNWLWTEAHLKDPDGNKIIIYHAGENRKNPPWKIVDDRN